MCSGALIWLFSPAWDSVKLTLQVGFICPFVVEDPTDLGATIVVAQALCLSIFNLSPMQKTCLFTNGNKANKSVCLVASQDPPRRKGGACAIVVWEQAAWLSSRATGCIKRLTRCLASESNGASRPGQATHRI